MEKIGMCFPEKDFLTLDFDRFKDYILLLKNNGLYSFDMYTSLLLSNHKNLFELLEFLNDNDIKMTFHYYNYTSLSGVEEVINQYKNDLISIRNKLEACNIYYPTTIVFHALNYGDEYQKYEYENNQVTIFNNICAIASKLSFDILVETLSYNHPEGNHLGDDYSEIINLVSRVNAKNFGICWDIGHTRLNSIEEYSNMYLPISLIDKVKFTHIHNYSLDDGEHEVIDHLPLTNKIYQHKELKYLLDNNYDGIYSIEMNTNNLQENINIYINSINILDNMLEEEKKNGKDNNGKNG